MNIETFIRERALSFPATAEAPHHKTLAFKVKGKIFVTLNLPERRATLHFSLENQDLFSAVSQGSIHPVPNKWGKYGWTTVHLDTVHPELLHDALLVAWRDTAPEAFQQQYPHWFEDEMEAGGQE